MPMTEKRLAQRDARRNLGAELLQSVREMKARMGKVVLKANTPVASQALAKTVRK